MTKKEQAVGQEIIDLAKSAQAPIAVQDKAWGAVEDLDTNDLLVPKIFHQQAMSKFVADGNARPGDFCDSLTGEVLSKKENPLEIIIFGAFKSMVISIYNSGEKKFKLDKIVTINKENAYEYAARPLFTEDEHGNQYKNNLQYNFYCLVPSKINDLPYVLSLGSTKAKSAKKLNTMLYRLNQMNKPGASVVFTLSSVAEKNDKGSWFGVEIAQGRNATDAELAKAHEWYLKSKTHKIVAAEEESHSGKGSVTEEDAPW